MHEMQETQVLSLGQEDPLEKERATHFSILVWKIPQTEEPGRLHSWISKSQTWLSARARVHTHTHTHTTYKWNEWMNHNCLFTCWLASWVQGLKIRNLYILSTQWRIVRRAGLSARHARLIISNQDSCQPHPAKSSVKEVVMAKRVVSWVGFAIFSMGHSCLPTLAISDPFTNGTDAQISCQSVESWTWVWVTPISEQVCELYQRELCDHKICHGDTQN